MKALTQIVLTVLFVVFCFASTPLDYSRLKDLPDERWDRKYAKTYGIIFLEYNTKTHRAFVVLGHTGITFMEEFWTFSDGEVRAKITHWNDYGVTRVVEVRTDYEVVDGVPSEFIYTEKPECAEKIAEIINLCLEGR